MPTLQCHLPQRCRPQLDGRTILEDQNPSGHFKPLEFLEQDEGKEAAGGRTKGGFCGLIPTHSLRRRVISSPTAVALKPLHAWNHLGCL